MKVVPNDEMQIMKKDSFTLTFRAFSRHFYPKRLTIICQKKEK